MRTIIFTGGECRTERVAEWLSSDCDFFAPRDVSSANKLGRDTLVIAADSGYDTALAVGVTPHLVVGDMDSVRHSLPTETEIMRVRPEKDDTDTMLAIDTALERGADSITVIGGAGGRADHWLSNIFMLEYLSDAGVAAELWDGINRITVVHDGSVVIPAGCCYFGILALDDSTVTASGCRYPLNKAPLRRNHPYAVSNEVVGESALVTVSGCAVVTVSYS